MDTASLKSIGDLSIPVETTYIMVTIMGSILVGDFPWKQYKQTPQVTPDMETLPCPCSLHGNQYMDNSHGFSIYVKATINHGLFLSKGDWGDPKGESTGHGPMLMEYDWGEKLMLNDTSECMLSEVN